MLHLYETLGWWRVGAAVKHVHFAEEWNEFNHLCIMESLGGDQDWRTRFLAGHAAIICETTDRLCSSLCHALFAHFCSSPPSPHTSYYSLLTSTTIPTPSDYWILVLLWLCSPTIAYNFSELIEAHAVDTYAQFVDENEEILKQLPAPRVAKAYYNSPNLYLFDEFQTSRPAGSRRPDANTLYDVFSNIRDDEGEHVQTMAACQGEAGLVRAAGKRAACPEKIPNRVRVAPSGDGALQLTMRRL